MAKESKTRFVTEVAPSKLVAQRKRPLAKKLDTIDEEERDFHANGSLSTPFGSSLDQEHTVKSPLLRRPFVLVQSQQQQKMNNCWQQQKMNNC